MPLIPLFMEVLGPEVKDSVVCRTKARSVAVLGWCCTCINGPQYIQQMLRNEKEIMGRKVTLKGEFWQKKWRSSRTPCRVQSLCWASRHGSADNTGGGRSDWNNYLRFPFPGVGLGSSELIKDPISVEKSYQDVSKFRTCHSMWLGSPGHSKQLPKKVKHVVLRSHMSSRPHRDSIRKQEAWI